LNTQHNYTFKHLSAHPYGLVDGVLGHDYEHLSTEASPERSYE